MGDCSNKAVRLKDRTASSFSFEWSKFSDICSEYEANFLSYIAPVGKDFFRGKRVLDAGCGAGRHAYFAAVYGAIVTAFDIGDGAVDATRRNLMRFPSARVWQADVHSLPHEWYNQFDYVMSIGVLHHLSDPQEGFNRLLPLLRKGGAISIWVYGQDDNRLARYLYEPLRRITTQLPHSLLYWLSLFPATAVDIANRLRLPLFSHYSAFPFRTKWNDAFDVFSAPSAKYFTVEDITEWFAGAGLSDVCVSHRMLGSTKKGIIGFGVKK